MKRLLPIIPFVFLYLRELIVSTARIAVMVVRPELNLSPKFAEMPLDLRGDFPTLIFVCLISMTPGSLSVALDRERHVLLIHLLDVRDPDGEIARMKASFETPLMKIFGQI